MDFLRVIRFIFSAENIFYSEHLNQHAISINTLMKGYLINNRPNSAIDLAQRLNKTERNSATYHLWAMAVSQLNDNNSADQLYEELNSLSSSIRMIFNQDCRLINALIHVKCSK